VNGKTQAARRARHPRLGGGDFPAAFFETDCIPCWAGCLDIRDLGRLGTASKALRQAEQAWPVVANSAHLGTNWFDMSSESVNGLVNRLGPEKDPDNIYRTTLVIAALARFSVQNQKTVTHCGAVSSLVEQLKAGHERAAPAAALALGHLAASYVTLFDHVHGEGGLFSRDNDEVQEAIEESGAVAALVTSLRADTLPSHSLQETCVRTLYTLADNHQEWHHEVLTSSGAIAALLTIAQDTAAIEATRNLAADALARLGGHRPSFVAGLDHAGGIAQLTNMLGREGMTSRVRSSAAILLGNFLTGKQDMTERPSPGIISPLVNLLIHGGPEEKTSAMWALGRFNCKHTSIRLSMISIGALVPMQAILLDSIRSGLSSDDLLLDVLGVLVLLAEDQAAAQKMSAGKLDKVLFNVLGGKCRVKEQDEVARDFLVGEIMRLARTVLCNMAAFDLALRGQLEGQGIVVATVPVPPPPPATAGSSAE